LIAERQVAGPHPFMPTESIDEQHLSGYELHQAFAGTAQMLLTFC